MDKLDIAVKRIQEASAMSIHFYEKPLLLTYSGGKDSDAALEVAKIAGIPFEIQHSHTTVDAPETVYHVREKFRALELEGIKCSINYPIYKGKRVSMWTLIPQKLMPPTTAVRYCCQVLKEQNGKKRFIATGVRWSESVKRRNSRGILENVARKNENKIVLTNDNDDRRRITESCAKLGSHVSNPIVDWDDREVWDLLQDRKVKCNPLYCEFHRVGCVGCPLAGKRMRGRGFLRWPKYKRGYLRAFDRMLIERQHRGLTTSKWQTAYDVLNWWMDYDILPGQIDLLEDDV